MILSYTLEEYDFLAFQLFSASKSKRIQRKKRNGWMLFSVGGVLIASYFYIIQNPIMAGYFGLVALASALFYPKYFRWRYKKHYRDYIRDNYVKRMGNEVELEIHEDSISSRDRTGQGNVFLKEIEKIHETGEHFFIQVSSGNSLIVPKKGVGDDGTFREKLENLGLIFVDEMDWKWE